MRRKSWRASSVLTALNCRAIGKTLPGACALANVQPGQRMRTSAPPHTQQRNAAPALAAATGMVARTPLETMTTPSLLDAFVRRSP
eukprot:1216119-Alexandrium_andersonii.AAC.1